MEGNHIYDALIAGGGISGLAAAWRLQREGLDVCLLEARERLGGRIHTVRVGGGAFDLGPSWFWPGQPRIASLLDHFGLSSFPQPSQGDYLFESGDGSLAPVPGLAPMGDALRVEGGFGALVDALQADLTVEILCGHVVELVRRRSGSLEVTALGPSGRRTFEARAVAISLPPRLAAELSYSPELSPDALRALGSVPTWMAGHAKVLAVYDRPFWWDQGLSGSAMSQRGPLGEIHDASSSTGRPAALFGFVALDAETRARIGGDALLRGAEQQLVRMFGPAAAHPVEVCLHDWSQEAATAVRADRLAPRGHPDYGLDPDPGPAWASSLHFIATETSFGNGGLIEGALERGEAFARSMVIPYLT